MSLRAVCRVDDTHTVYRNNVPPLQMGDAHAAGFASWPAIVEMGCLLAYGASRPTWCITAG
jgi:hypothetical protein